MIIACYYYCKIDEKVKKIIYSKKNYIVTIFNFVVVNMIFLSYVCDGKRRK